MGGLEKAIEQSRIEQGFLPDTNILVYQPLAPHILANDWDSVREDKYGRELIESIEKQRILKSTPNDVYILDLVEDEIDKLMHDYKKGEVKGMAGRARAVLHKIRMQGQVAAENNESLVRLQNGATVHFIKHNEAEFLKEGRFEPTMDDRIAWNFARLVSADKNSSRVYQFVSQDVYCRSKVLDRIAQVYRGDEEQVQKTLASAAEFEFENASEDPHLQYPGIIRITARKDSEFQNFQRGPVRLDEEGSRLQSLELKANQFIEMSHKERTVGRIVNGDCTEALPLVHVQEFKDYIKKQARTELPRMKSDLEVPQGVTVRDIERLIIDADISASYAQNLRETLRKSRKDPERAYRDIQWSLLHNAKKHGGKNVLALPFNGNLRPVAEQIYALEVLNNPDIPIVSIVGPQGSGKTLWTLFAGLTQIDQARYTEMTYFRPHVGLDEGVGFLKGDERAKMRPWVQPCKDSMLEIFGAYDGKPGYKQRCVDEVERLEREGIVNFDATTWQGGRTWRNSYTIVDEAQLITRKQMKLLVGRVGNGNKLVLLGDPEQVGATERVTHWFLHRFNNGISHVIESLQGQSLYAHITFTSEEVVRRSEAAKLARLL